MSDADPIPRLNAALAGRYVIQRVIRVGGMATVYLADDLKHHRVVALKVLDPKLGAALGAERFLREISIAAGFTHPHILPLHDSGEADGLLYFVMPFVEDESLRERLDRERELPLQDALKIAIEVAHALSYAHEHGVVHRDIKPANILLPSGEAVVADFGIAQATDTVSDLRLTQAGESTGTPLYMSPEQVDGRDDVDGRSDVFALGCVLYEMLTGVTPWQGTSFSAVIARRITEPVRPVRETRASIPESVEHAVMRALEKVPADRFSTADEFARALEPALGTGGRPYAPPPARRRRRTWAAGILLPLVASALFLLTTSTEGIAFAERDWIIIADLENHTEEEVFDRSLNTALNVAVGQSQYVNIYPRTRVNETLQRMGRTDVEVLDETLAVEVAVREGVKAVVSFEVASVGETYLLSTSVIEPETGVSVYAESSRADGKDEILMAVDDLARRLRTNLGESLSMIQERSVPLPQATTSSLEALKRYTDGSQAWSASRWVEARTLWREAVALDSQFAWAHASVGLAEDWLEGAGSGQPHFETALGLLDRVTERERQWIRSLIEDGEPMVETLRIFTRQYPDDRDGWYNLGNGLRTIGRPEEALEAYGHALALDSLNVWSYINRGMVFVDLGRDEEAVGAFGNAFRIDPASRSRSRGDINRISGFALAKAGDTVAARETFELLLEGSADERANGLRSLGLLELTRGRAEAAISRFEEAVVLTETTGSRLSEYRNRLYLASAHAAVGHEAEARRERGIAERIGQDIDPGPFWLAILAQQYARAGAVEQAQGVFDLMETRPAPVPTDYRRAIMEHIRGELALARGEPTEAVRLLEAAAGLSRTPGRLEALAHAYVGAGDREAARSAYEELLSAKRMGDESQTYWMWAHVHLGQVYEDLGEFESAADRYRALLEMVGDGDEDLLILQQATSGLERTEGRA